MGTLAVLFAVLAVAVPLQESASAQTPEPSISLTVSDVKFETATVDITVTNVNSTNIPALNWRVNVVFKTDAYEHPHKNAGPTHPVSPGQESYSFLYNVSNTGTVTADVDLNWLIPASEYTVEVKLCDTDCGSRNVKAEASTTFSTKSGCTAQPEPNRGKWFPGYNFTKVTENELSVIVHVNSSYAPLNSGRCVYYTYNTYFEDDDSEILTAYIRHISTGGRNALIELTGLEPGTRYGYHITLDEEAEDNAAGFSGSTLGPNTGISDIVFTNITNDSAKATATVKNASTDDKFVYWRYRESPLDGDPGIWLTLDKVSTKTSTADKDLNYLDAGTRYEVEASVKDNFNLGMSMTRAFVTLPGKPGISPLEAGDGSLKVTWTAPTEGAATITGYTVKWQESEEYFDYNTFPPPTLTLDDADVDEDDTSYTITGLTNGTEYRVHVIAKNESGGTESNGEFGTPMGLPNAPNNLQVAPGNEKLTLTWEEPTEKVGVTVNGYKVQWKADSVTDWDAQTGVTEVSESGLTREIASLTNGTTYDVRVRAENGVVSDTYDWATDDGTPRPDPTITEVTVADATITRTSATATVTIENETDDGQTVHLQYRKTTESGWTPVTPKDVTATATSETFDLSGLTGNTEYLVEAWLAATSSTKESATFTTDPVEADAPRNVRITGHGDKELTVAWDAPSDSGGSQITGYKVQWKSGSDGYDPNLRQDEPGASPHTIDQLANGTEYTVQVIAVTTAGDGSPSTEAKGTPSRKPDAPIIQSVTPGHTQLVVTWSEPANGGNPITNYKIEYKEQDAQSWRLHKEVDHNTLTETIGSLTNGTIYVVQVSAKNINGYGDPSVEEPGTPRPDPSVSGVTVAETSITRTTAIATVAIDNQTSESQTVHLRHRVNTSGSSWTDATPKDTSAATETFDLSSLTGNTEYLVEAWLAGTSSTKESVTFTTDPVEADAPRNVRITGHGDKELTVAWDAPSDTGGSQITGYKVQWKLSSQNDWNTSTEREDDDDQSPYKITENLTNGDEYAVRIIAVTSAGDGSPSNEAKDTPRTIPDAPTITNVTVGDRKLTATWTAPNEDGGAEITGYKVQWKDNSITTTWDSPMGVTEVSVSGLTREITGLTNETTYGVRVRADNGETSTAYNWDEDSGIPKPDPSVGSVSVGEIEQTTAVATVTIADPTGDAKMVHLRYRVSSSSEVWTTPTPQSTTTNSVAFPQFTGLKSDTEYRVEASFDGNFVNAVISKTFKTKRPTVSSVEIDENTIGQAGATAIVRIQEPNGETQTVHLRYRPFTQDDWSTTASDAGYIPYRTTLDAVSIQIADLKSDTLYEVEASLESDYSQSKTTTFTTEGPSLTGLTISEVMQESAKAIIDIEAPHGRSLPVFVRYRKVTDPVNGLWVYVDTSSTSATADAPLSNLTSGTEYEVQASLVRVFPDEKTISETFTTHDPSLSGLTVMSVTLTGATLKVDIQAHNDESQTINYRYRPVTQNDWTTTATDAGSDSTTSTTGNAEFTLASLTSGIQYQVQASLDSDLDNPTLPVLEAKFTTLTPDPSISDVAIDAKQTMAKATITIANPGASGNTVHLHFRVQNTNTWSSPALTSATNTSEATIDMTSLTERTTYEVEVALNSGFTSSTIVTFTTLVKPTITSVSVDDITKTTATATVAIANSDGTDRTVHLQYREKDATPADTWTKVMEDSDTGSQEFDLSSLTPGTTYEVEASFDSNFVTGVEDTEFTTTYAPSVSSVSVGDITKTTATATVSIANPDDMSRTVHLQYRVKDADPEDTWTKAMEDTDTGSQEFGLTGLTPGTTYEVQASFDSSFSPHKDTTFTTVFEPSISGVSVGSIEKTTATATVIIANPDGTNKTVNLQYREYNKSPEAEWTKLTPQDTDTGSETFDLSSLIPGTTYEVQASFDTNFDTYKDTTFTTKFAPTISAVRVDPDSITKTTASVIVIIANPDGTDQTVQLQYRIKDPQGNWSSTQTEDTTTGSATINLTGLTAGTTYDVEVSLASGFGSTQTATFTTKYEPSISSVSMGSVTQTTASAAISIDNADGSTQTVHLQYREKDATPPAGWTSATPETSTTSAASIDISGLTADKTYEVEAWLASDITMKVTATFTTLEAPNGTPTPSVSSVAVSNITMTTATATVNIANPGTAANTVNLRHSVKGANSWTDHTKSETGSTVSFPLSSLIAGTTYEVEAWPGSDTANKVTATFTTSPAPSISSIGVGGITKISATATVNIANPGTAQNTVNLRYSVDGEDSWTDHTKTETGSTVSFPLSGLTAGTTYEVEAWLGSDTGNKATATFTTTQAAAETPPPPYNPPPQRSPANPTPPVTKSPQVSGVTFGNITQTTADATVNIDDAGTAQNTVNLRYSVDGENSWTDHTKTETGSTVRFPLSSLMAGTAYEVEAWLGSDTDNKVTATFTTSMAPSISSIGVGGITKTSATATVNIRDAGTAQNTVNLRHSVDGEDSWTDHTKTEAGSTVEFPLSSLTAGTTYEVEAWLGSDTDNKVTATFMTTQADAVTPPSISSVRVLNIAQTNARVVVGLANANTGQRVYMQYKLSSAQWPTTLPQPTTQMNGSATFILSNLTAGTGYHTRVSLNSDMSDATTRSFTTSPPPPPQNPRPPRSPVVPPPSVSLVTFNNETQTSADATVNIADAGTAKKTVRLHHRIEGTTGWSTPPKSENTSGSSTTFALMSLTAGTTYEVQAWLNSNAAPAGTTVYTFGTLPNDPGISNLKMENIRQTSATAMVEIADAGTEMKEVYLKHSTDGADEWTQIPFPTITYSDSTSIDLTGLEEQTTYQVMVDLTDGFDKPKSATFTTLAAPSLSGVSISTITQTSAVATATIADAGTAQKTVHLRYREFGESQWSTAQTRTTTDASTTFNLSTLSPRTTYEVQASLENDFSISKFAVFTTLSPDPSVSGVSVGSITQTSATATVIIAYPGIALKTVHLRYRMSGETEWGAVQTKATSGGSTAINLIGLSPRTMYEVEASLGSDFAGSKTTTFSTLSLDPSVSGVSIGSITQTSAAATVTIANPGTAQKTVYLQYRVDGASEWSDSALTATTNGSSATIYMTGLIADTEYEVRASLASDFALAQHATFTTLRYPSISNVEVTDVTKTTATAEIDIANPDGSSQTVHLRHRTTTPQGEWSSTFTTASTTGDASIDLTGLTVDTEYEVEASLTSDFAVAVSDTFRTLPPDPVVAEISVNNIRQTTATAYIDIANSNGSSQPVSLRYRNTTPRGNWSNIQTTTSTTDSASIDLSGLTPGTDYDVQASLDDSFPATRTKSATFTTLRGPSIASFEAENIGRNGATVSAMIADSHGVAQTVYVRHRDVRYNAWKPTQQTDSVDDVASIRLRGLSSGTEYIAEASLDNSFPDGGTRSVTFTTKEREDDDDGSSSVGGNVAQAARAANVPLLGFSPQMLRFVAIEGGDNPAPQAFSVWNRAHGSMSFNLSNHEEWLSQQPMSGVSNGPDDPVTITASVDSSALASGQYVDIINIDVSSSGKSPAQVIVVLDVLPPDYIRQFVSRDEGGVVVLPDGTVKIVVQPLAPPKDVDIELMKVNLQAHGQPPGEKERVVVAIESNTYEPGGDTPEDVAYAPYVELWVQLPQEDAAACDESRARMYSVQSGAWSLVEHRCETDESGKVWVVAQVERLGAFALVIDDAPVSPTPTPVAAAVAATATPTAIPASAPAVAAQRISLPAQPPTPVPTSVPTAVPMPNGKTTVAPAMAPTPTPTAVPAGNEPSAPMMQASAGDGGSGGFGRIILAALGLPMLIGTLIVVYLLYRERRRRDDARMI